MSQQTMTNQYVSIFVFDACKIITQIKDEIDKCSSYEQDEYWLNHIRDIEI
jgi:hypothetical protein